MKKTAAVLILLAFSLTALPQSVRKVVYFTGEDDCGYKSRSGSDPGNTKCRTFSTDRGPVSEIEQDGVVLSIAYLEDGDYIILAARIANLTPEPVMFDTDIWGAAHFRSKEGFYSGEKPVVAETSVPTREIIRAMSSSTKLDNSLDVFIAESQKSSETKETRRNDGTIVRTTVFVPDKAALESAQRKSELRTESMTGNQRKIRENALTSKYVSSNGSVKGLVYFRRIKEAELVVLSLIVGDTRFVFRFPRKPK